MALEISRCVWYKQSFYTYLSTFELLGISSFIANDVLPQCLAWLLTDSEACGIRYYLLKQCTRRLRWRLARHVKHMMHLFIWNVADGDLESMVLDVVKWLWLFFSNAGVPGRTHTPWLVGQQPRSVLVTPALFSFFKSRVAWQLWTWWCWQDHPTSELPNSLYYNTCWTTVSNEKWHHWLLAKWSQEPSLLFSSSWHSYGWPLTPLPVHQLSESPGLPISTDCLMMCTPLAIMIQSHCWGTYGWTSGLRISCSL